MSLIHLFELKTLGDERGHLNVLENSRNIPFDIKRVYYLTGTLPGVPRGFHAHKQLRQVAVCVSGSCKMKMDDGTQREEVLLDAPNKAIFIDKMIWHEMHEFSSDCVLLVLADDFYDEQDYIRDYSVFMELIKNA
jgi:dTDP-4-dehydrorhamnose 3,5-epimerase-like enzyme